jgi:hypothetical protein
VSEHCLGNSRLGGNLLLRHRLGHRWVAGYDRYRGGLRNRAGCWIRGRVCRSRVYFLATSSSRNEATLPSIAVRNTPDLRTFISRFFRWPGEACLCAAARRSGQWKNKRVYPGPREGNSLSRYSKSTQKPTRPPQRSRVEKVPVLSSRDPKPLTRYERDRAPIQDDALRTDFQISWSRPGVEGRCKISNFQRCRRPRSDPNCLRPACPAGGSDAGLTVGPAGCIGYRRDGLLGWWGRRQKIDRSAPRGEALVTG